MTDLSHHIIWRWGQKNQQGFQYKPELHNLQSLMGQEVNEKYYFYFAANPVALSLSQ